MQSSSMLIFLIVVLTAFALIGGVILKLSVILANRLIGRSIPVTPVAEFIQPKPQPLQDQPDESDLENPFSTPRATPSLERDPRPQHGIPVPRYLKCLGICLLVIVGWMVVLIVSNSVVASTRLLSIALSIALTIAMGISLIKALLPTSWRLAFIVAILFVALCVAVAIIVGLPMLIFG